VDQQTDLISHLAAALGVDTKEVKPMGQLDSFAEDVNEVIADLNKQFEALNERKQRLKTNGTEIAGKWAAHFDAQDASLKAAEAALNRISNVLVSQEKPNAG
jgi:ABC-type transporter Mla subunit MlaD